MKMKFKKRHWRQPGAGPCNCPHSKNEPLEQDAAQFLQGERLCQACVFLAHGFCVERRKKQAVDKLQQRPEQHGSA